jgi:hypothetical protein
MKYYNEQIELFFPHCFKDVAKVLTNEEKRYFVNVLLTDNNAVDFLLRQIYIYPPPISIEIFNYVQEAIRNFVSCKFVIAQLKRNEMLFDDFIIGQEYVVHARPSDVLSNNLIVGDIGVIRFVLTSLQLLCIANVETTYPQLHLLSDWTKMKITVKWVSDDMSVIRTESIEIIE